MILNKKNITKLLNDDFRHRILTSASESRLKNLKIYEYAKYVVDSQIVSRDASRENDKKSFYGFSPINVLCAVKKSGEIDKKFFEFNVINHFLHEKKAELAIEVVMCILKIWADNDKSIEDFDYMKIDAELAKIDEEIAKSKEAKEEKETTSEVSANECD